MMKILLADPHTIVREGVAKLLLKAYPFAKIREVADSKQMLKLVRKENWSIVITEICMPPGNSGLEAIKEIKLLAPGLKVLVLSIYGNEQFAVRAMKAGAYGYLSKATCFSEIYTAVNQILSGRKYISAQVGDLLADCIALDHRDSIGQLSDREFEVLRWLGKGYTISGIARQTTSNPTTISTFRSRIFGKLGFKNNCEMIRYTVDHHLS